MAETFNVPEKYAGLTLKQIRDKTNASFRPDILAGFLGINENTPLKAGQNLSTAGFPSSYVGTSGEWQALSSIFNAGSSTSTKADEYIDAIDPLIKRERELAEKLFGPDNAFSFDEYQASQDAQAEFAPEYTELLTDYLDNIGIQKESLQGDQKLLKALETTPEGTAGEATRAYERAVDQAERGFAGKGMFFSGFKKRALGQAEVERQQGLQQQIGDITNKREAIFGGYTNYGGVEGSNTNSAFGEAVQGGINQRRDIAQKEYYTPRVQEYLREFPIESNPLAGYILPNYLTYS